jgi:hypothetical protein
MALNHLIFLLLYFLGGGFFVSLGFVKPREVGIRYYRLHGLITAFALFLVYWLTGKAYLDSATTLWFSLFLACLVLFSLFTGVNHKISAASYFLGLIGFYGSSFMALDQVSLGGEPTYLLINCFLAIGVLGFSMAAMWLGHWYLTTPKLSISELKRVVAVMIGFLVLRFIFSSYQTGVLLWGRTEAELWRYLMTVPGVFVLMRDLWGILLSLILSVLVWKTLKIRSTQSATGLLYVLVLSCLTGEILSMYLSFYFGIHL